MASTVLPNGIIIPEKYSRDWYNDLYHNWQELDNLLGGGTPKDGTLTIQKNGATVGTFSANQATNETINIEVPTVNDATLTIQQNGTTVDTFTANSSTDKTVNIAIPTKTSDLTNDSNFVPSTDLATVATSGSYNDLSNKPTIPTVNNATLTIQKNGTNVQTFTANQSTNATANITVPTKTSDLTNDSGFITSDNTKIPLAGSNAISGDLVPSTDGTVNLGSNSYFWKNSYINNIYAKQYNVNTPYLNTQVINIAKPNNPSSYLTQDIVLAKDLNGKLISKFRVDVSTNGPVLCSFYVTKNNSTNDNELFGYYFSVDTSGETAFVPSDNNSTKLGVSTVRWKEIWCTQSSINSSSDERQKQQIKPINNDLLDAWENVNPIEFKWNDAVAEKGDNARIHTGYIAQNIQQALTENGVNPNDYGLFLYDEWGEEQEEKDEQGNIVRPYRPSGNAYGLRYTEALVVECMYLRRCIARLTARIEELEKGNNTK